MFKKYLLLIVIILLFPTGCIFTPKEQVQKFYLEEKYYNGNDFIKVTSEELDNMEEESYVLYVYNSFCKYSVPCETIFKSYIDKNKVSFLSIPFEDYKNSYLYKDVKYSPTIIIVYQGKVMAYLDAESDKDMDKYQDTDKFEEWVNTYIFPTI